MFPTDTTTTDTAMTAEAQTDYLRGPADFHVVYNDRGPYAKLLLSDEHGMLKFPTAPTGAALQLDKQFAFSLNGIMITRHQSRMPVVTLIAPEQLFDALLGYFIPSDQDTLRACIEAARVEYSVHRLARSSKSGRHSTSTTVNIETFQSLNDSILDVQHAAGYDPEQAFINIDSHPLF